MLIGEVPFLSCHWLNATDAQGFGDGIPLAFDLGQFRQGDHADVLGQAVGFYAWVDDPQMSELQLLQGRAHGVP